MASNEHYQVVLLQEPFEMEGYIIKFIVAHVHTLLSKRSPRTAGCAISRQSTEKGTTFSSEAYDMKIHCPIWLEVDMRLDDGISVRSTLSTTTFPLGTLKVMPVGAVLMRSRVLEPGDSGVPPRALGLRASHWCPAIQLPS